MKKLVFYSNSVINGLQNKLANSLGEISGYDDYKLFMCNSGAEANVNALKLALFHTGKRKMILKS
jgi:acetylornithine/N-succinyldiaminopimelate aminotransferase